MKQKKPKSLRQLSESAMRRIEDASRSESKCKICMSQLRGEIDVRIIDGETHEAIINFASNHGFRLSSSGISRHRNNHLLALESEAVKQLEDPETAIKKVLARLVRELEYRDLENLSTKQLAAYTQAALEVSVAFRSPPPTE